MDDKILDLQNLNEYQKDCIYRGSLAFMIEYNEKIQEVLKKAKETGYRYSPETLKSIDEFMKHFDQFRKINHEIVEDFMK